MDADARRINQQLMEIEQEYNDEIERVAAVQAEVAGHGGRGHGQGGGAAVGGGAAAGRRGDADNMDVDADNANVPGNAGGNGAGAGGPNNNNNNHGNNHNGGDRNGEHGDDGDGDDDDEEEEEEGAEEEEEDDGPFLNADGVIDGGVATGKGADQPATNMYLLIECQERLLHDQHPIYQPGITVSIGLDKSTRLSAVFHRYLEFAQESNMNINNNIKVSADPHPIDISELEFIHCSVLSPSDTAEAAALMKNDRIKVQRIREKERRAEAEWIKTQRDSDRDYFSQLRNLLLLPGAGPSTGSGPGSGSGLMDMNLNSNNLNLKPSPSSTSPSSSSHSSSPLKCDVVFHCQGRIKDDKGYKQEVLTTYVRGHSALLMKRCKWLSNQIMLAKGEFGDKNMNGRNDGNGNDHNRHRQRQRHRHDGNDHVVERERDDDDDRISNILADDDGDDDGIVLQPDHAHDQNIRDNNGNNNNNGANAVEVDDDDDEVNRVHNIQDVSADESSPFQPSTSRAVSRVGGVDIGGDGGGGERNSPYIGGNFPNTLCVPLSHPPEAVKLLLEYCYTNRVVPLGQNAFKRSYVPPDLNTVDASLIPHTGPISPFPSPHGLRSCWPNNGRPTVSLPIALAGIRLAEEANLPRLSLMCEVAASHLITNMTEALEALSLCEQQYKETGNRLKHLRKIVMVHHILRRTCDMRSTNYNCHVRSFEKVLREKSDLVVPSLLKGVLETVNDALGEKRNVSDHIYCHNFLVNMKKSTNNKFLKYDEDDSLDRNQERIKWRKERWGKRPRWNDYEKNPYGLEDDLDFEAVGHSRRSISMGYRSVLETVPDQPFIVDGTSYTHLPADLTNMRKNKRPRRKGKYSTGGGSRTQKSRKR